jgi:hypothetical protein
MHTDTHLLTALIVQADRLYFATALAAMPPHAEYSRLYHYDAQSTRPWSYHDVRFWMVALEKFRDGADDAWTLCALSERGEMERVSRGKATVERIADAGLYRSGSAGYGYLTKLREIGGYLHVCGDGGQVYKRLGSDKWAHMDDGLLQPPDVKDRLLLSTIDGPAEDDLYVGGNRPSSSGRVGCLFHWNGARWRAIDLPVVGGINAIYIESEERVWLAGRKGTLLVGNHRSGFESLFAHQSPQLFHDLTMFNGVLYLGSNFGLFRYDEVRRRVVRERTNLSSELSYISTVAQADGVLWAVGPADIARFDRKSWTRLQHPYSLPVGG